MLAQDSCSWAPYCSPAVPLLFPCCSPAMRGQAPCCAGTSAAPGAKKMGSEFNSDPIFFA